MKRLAYFQHLSRNNNKGEIAITIAIIGIVILLGGLVAGKQVVQMGVQLFSQSQSAPFCTDLDDDGPDIYVKGQTCTEVVCIYDSCIEHDETAVAELFCSGTTGQVEPLPCNQGDVCRDGACVPNPTTAFCTDDDGDHNIYVKGTRCSEPGCLSDFCDSTTQLTELFCVGTVGRSEKLTCPVGSGCVDGACTGGPTPSNTPVPSSVTPATATPADTPVPSDTTPPPVPGNATLSCSFLQTTGGNDVYQVTFTHNSVTDNQGGVGLHATPYWAQVSTDDYVTVPQDWENTWNSNTTHIGMVAIPAGTNVSVAGHVQARDAHDNQSGWSSNSARVLSQANCTDVPVPTYTPTPTGSPTPTPGSPGACNVNPTDIVIAIDRSGSLGDAMGTVGTETKLLLEWEKEAAQIFVDAFSFLPGASNNINISVVDWAGVSANINSSGTLTNDFAALKTYISGIQSPASDSYTCIQCGLRSAGQILEGPDPVNSPNTNTKVIVIMSDGIANREWGSNANVQPPGSQPCVDVPSYGWHCPAADQLAIDEATAWKQKNTFLHVIGYGDNTSQPPSILENNLQDIASNPTANHYHYGADPADWDNIFVDISTEICPDITTVIDALKQIYPNLGITSSNYNPPNIIVPNCNYPDSANITCPNEPPYNNALLYEDLAFFLNVLRGDITLTYDPSRPDLDKNGDQLIDNTDVIALIGLVSGELDARLEVALNKQYR